LHRATSASSRSIHQAVGGMAGVCAFRPKTRVASGRTPAVWSPIQSGMKLGSDRQSLWRARKAARRTRSSSGLAMSIPYGDGRRHGESSAEVPPRFNRSPRNSSREASAPISFAQATSASTTRRANERTPVLSSIELVFLDLCPERRCCALGARRRRPDASQSNFSRR
jgi:hypothetical protein